MGKRGLIMKKGFIVNHDFFKTWSADMAYILGFITADGCVMTKRKLLTIGLAEKDECVLRYIKNKLFIKDNGRIAKTYRIPKKFPDRRYNSVKLNIFSKIMLEDLAKLGVKDRKTGKEKWPNPPKEFVGDYIRGYFDGDGFAYKRKRDSGYDTGISCANKRFLKEIQKNLDGIGKISKACIYNLRITNVQEIIKFKNIIYTGNSFYLERKYDILKDCNHETLSVRISTKEERKLIEEAYKIGGTNGVGKYCNEVGINKYVALRNLYKKSFYKHKPKWTEEQLKLFETKTYDEIQKITGMKRRAISHMGKKIRKQKGMSPLWSKLSCLEIKFIEDNANSMSIEDISKSINRSKSVVESRVYKIRKVQCRQ